MVSPVVRHASLLCCDGWVSDPWRWPCRGPLCAQGGRTQAFAGPPSTAAGLDLNGLPGQIRWEMTESRSFLLRHVGTRFEGHRLAARRPARPIRVPGSVGLLREVGKWRAAHTQRERLPKGFEKSIAFDLVGIKNGSAALQLEWDRDTARISCCQILTTSWKCWWKRPIPRSSIL